MNPNRRHRYSAMLRLCVLFIIYLLATLIWFERQQQTSVALAIAKGQQLYLPADGQPVGLSPALLSNLATADSSLIFVNAVPLSVGEARPWVDLGCTANNCAHATYFDQENGGTVNNIISLPDNTVLASWTDGLARPAGSQFVAEAAIAIAANDPAVTAVLGDIGAGNPAMIPISAWLADGSC
ncbi:hypothetical protein MNBD_CHLOROFLEXI01-3725, partial [hydrothermal vent metagenome]